MENNEINEMMPSLNASSSPTSTSNSSKDSTSVNIKKKDLSDPTVTANISKLGNVNINVIDEEVVVKPEAIIEPKDQETIKYLSNVTDASSGEVSKPFIISDKKYQMVRGITPSREKVMGVYCHNDVNDSGKNIIHRIEEFEKNIVGPVMEKEKMMGNDIEEVENPVVKKKPDSKAIDSLNLAEFKHFLVNEKSGKFRKFKSVGELAKATMEEGEKYMTIKEFKKFFEGKIFGNKKVITKSELTESLTPKTIIRTIKVKDIK